ncbi:MAG: hypothetical protein CM15mV71_370 [Caudoviricetes sp.]|nr:MAG: hypothetical protein CM15mV71_370 [Caudoviricetes sp.]
MEKLDGFYPKKIVFEGGPITKSQKFTLLDPVHQRAVDLAAGADAAGILL